MRCDRCGEKIEDTKHLNRYDWNKYVLCDSCHNLWVNVIYDKVGLNKLKSKSPEWLKLWHNTFKKFLGYRKPFVFR